MIPTLEFDPTSEIVLQNTQLNATSIALLLNAHFLSHYLNDFLDLDIAPICGEKTLRRQFENYGTIKLNTRLDFYFDKSSFSDPDDDVLSYSVVGLPCFLTFYNSNFRLYGTPTFLDLRCVSCNYHRF